MNQRGQPYAFEWNRSIANHVRNEILAQENLLFKAINIRFDGCICNSNSQSSNSEDEFVKIC